MLSCRNCKTKQIYLQWFSCRALYLSTILHTGFFFLWTQIIKNYQNLRGFIDIWNVESSKLLGGNRDGLGSISGVDFKSLASSFHSAKPVALSTVVNLHVMDKLWQMYFETLLCVNLYCRYLHNTPLVKM